MANERIEKILAAQKNKDKQQKVKPSQPRASIPQFKNEKPIFERVKDADKAISAIDEAYNAPYIPSQKEKEDWNFEKGRNEVEKMSDKSFLMEKMKNSKMPLAILKSIAQNPCNYDPSAMSQLSVPESEFYKKLNETFNNKEEMKGSQAVQLINETLEKKDKEKNALNETEQPMQPVSGQGVDYNMIAKIVENVIDKKLGLLNESRQRGNAPIRAMALTENGSFRFMDTEGNVYECQMKYLGKKKAKKQ